eukprot:CAMPEP_0169151272 /NCGR_PEP_ID=MMETSP1015-20121227/50710_1 /TAXON_ID=342587 /ORGANISM="Karlodinium micrum, Strain CCMP2283" /LENGTH=193 /DNA_ID=CAMNT_0009220625 /DNA_START=411 /DNA_END=992 /DNA_ORIENTATION=+
MAGTIECRARSRHIDSTCMEMIAKKYNVHRIWDFPRIDQSESAKLVSFTWWHIILNMARSLTIKVATAAIVDGLQASWVSFECCVSLSKTPRQPRKIAPLRIIVSGIESDDFKWQCGSTEITPFDSVADVICHVAVGDFWLDWALSSIEICAVAASESTCGHIEKSTCAELRALALFACAPITGTSDIDQMSI